MRELKDFIYIERDVLGKDLRTKILQEYANSNEWEESVMGEKQEVNKTVRDVCEIGISKPMVVKKNFAQRTEIDKELYFCASKVLQGYQNKTTPIWIENDEGYVLLRYQSKQFYAEHVDSAPVKTRTLSCSFAVNDDYDGGEWSFFGGTYTEKLNAGDAIMFPSNFMFPHSIRPVESGIRYSIVTWFW